MEQQSTSPEPLSVIQQKVDEWFTYHSSSAEQQEKYAKLRHAAKQLAHLILENCPAGPSQDAAIMDEVNFRKFARVTQRPNLCYD